MEPPGTIPPDKDNLLSIQQQYSHTPQTGQHSITSSSLMGVSTIAQQQHQLYQQSLSSQSQSHNQQSQSQPQPQPQLLERISRPMAFDKMELFLRQMQDPEFGVPVRSQKQLFLTSVPSAFMGYDLIEWLTERLDIEESEALNIANQLCLHGYFFPVNDKSLTVRDDSSLYRFQTPYYWPWQHKAPDNVDYAIYLVKRSMRNKQRHGLEDYETEVSTNLHKNLKAKWDFITMQAEEQVKLAKDRKKGDKIVADSQERAFWRVHRPPPLQFTPLEPCPVPLRDRKPKKRTIEDCQREVDYLKTSLVRTRIKMSQACDFLQQYCETFLEYDFFLQPALPSNPWVTEDTTFWQLNSPVVDTPTEKRVKRWSISIEELVSDATGLQEFTSYLKKEYSHENIRFWTAVNDLRSSAHSQIPRKVKEIYEEFLEPGAPCEINIDGKTMERVQLGLKNPTRFTFDAAAEHIYALLLKKDCYPRFIRSDHYKGLLATGIQPSHKKRFFGFGSGVGKKKSSTTATPNVTLLTQGPGSSIVASATGVNLSRRRGSDRSLTGSAHELAVIGIKDGNNKVPHSHSQSNLSDIPYSVVVYRGDMPSSGGLSLPVTMEIPPNQLESSTTTSEVEDAFSKYQEGSKSHHDNIEPNKLTSIGIAESNVSNVCPWDTIDEQLPTTSYNIGINKSGPNRTTSVGVAATTVSVSVCPWDEISDGNDDIADTNNDDVEKCNVLPTIKAAAAESINPAQGKKPLKKHSAIESCSSNEINEVSERMRRSCGLRQQNTLDCELYSSKRLIPTSNEQRRASMTIAPKLSDLQFSIQPVQCCPVTQNIILPVQSITTTTISPEIQTPLIHSSIITLSTTTTTTTIAKNTTASLRPSTTPTITTPLLVQPVLIFQKNDCDTNRNDRDDDDDIEIDIEQREQKHQYQTEIIDHQDHQDLQLAETHQLVQLPSDTIQSQSQSYASATTSAMQLPFASYIADDMNKNESINLSLVKKDSLIFDENIEIDLNNKVEMVNEENLLQTLNINNNNNNNNNNNENVNRFRTVNSNNNNNNENVVLPLILENINLNNNNQISISNSTSIINTMDNNNIIRCNNDTDDDNTLIPPQSITSTVSISSIIAASASPLASPSYANVVIPSESVKSIVDLKNIEIDIDNNNLIKSFNAKCYETSMLSMPYSIAEIDDKKIEMDMSTVTEEEEEDPFGIEISQYPDGGESASSSSIQMDNDGDDPKDGTSNITELRDISTKIIKSTHSRSSPTTTSSGKTSKNDEKYFHRMSSVSEGDGTIAIGIGGGGDDEEQLLHHQEEELSPITDEYQESCSISNRNAVYHFDLNSGEYVGSGYVAPAPTPSPLIAPLAEIEMDVPDEDFAIDNYQSGQQQQQQQFEITASITSIIPKTTSCIASATSLSSDYLPTAVIPSSTTTDDVPLVTVSSSSNVPFQTIIPPSSTTTTTPGDGNSEHVKRKRKKKDGIDAKGEKAKGNTTAGNKTEEQQSSTHDPVCPWEDEDYASTSDAPFVKTYATLGYL